MHNLVCEFERNVEYLKLHRMLHRSAGAARVTPKSVSGLVSNLRRCICLFCGMKKQGDERNVIRTGSSQRALPLILSPLQSDTTEKESPITKSQRMPWSDSSISTQQAENTALPLLCLFEAILPWQMDGF